MSTGVHTYFARTAGVQDARYRSLGLELMCLTYRDV